MLLHSSDLETRQQMDCRRLEEAFLQYAMLKAYVWYPLLSKNDLSFHEGLCNLLSCVTPRPLSTFIRNYAGLL